MAGFAEPGFLRHLFRLRQAQSDNFLLTIQTRSKRLTYCVFSTGFAPLRLLTEICRMQLLITAATEMEIAPFLAHSTDTDYLVTGVGVPACLYQLQKKLFSVKYDCVIQAGIAGTFTTDIALGETVLIGKDIFADLGMFENNQFQSLFQTDFIKKDEPPYTDGWLQNNPKLMDQFSLPKCTGITVNTVTDNTTIINEYKRLYHPMIESMEGAALHYVCGMQHTPFLQLRAVSNMVGERDKSKWNIAAAVHNLNNHLQEIVQVLKLHG